MIYLKSLFNKSTYKEKISSVTYLRFVSFQIWKCLLLIASLFILHIVNYIFIINRYITFALSLKIYITLLVLGLGIDYIKLFFFKHNQNQNGIFERIVKLFLVPSQSTFAFFFLLILTQFNITSIKSAFTINSSSPEKDESMEYSSETKSELTNLKGSDFTLLFSYSLIYSFQVISKHSFFNWPKINKTRIDCFKSASKKSIQRSMQLMLYHVIIGTFHYIMKNNSIAIGCDILIYSMIIFYSEMFQYISSQLLKCFICSPINPDSDEIKNELELIAYPLSLTSNPSFIIIHYLKILNEVLLKAYYEPKNQLNFALKENNSIYKEIKSKIDSIYTRINEKIKIVHYSLKQQAKTGSSGLMFWFDFSKNEIFEYETSPEIIDAITEVIYSNILLLSLNKHNNGNNKEINLNEEQYYIVYLIDRLFGFETVVKELKHLIDNNITQSKSKGMLKISQHLNRILIKIQMKIKSVVHKNLKGNFLINCCDNIKELIKLFRI